MAGRAKLTAMNLPGIETMPSWLENVWLERYLNRELNRDEVAAFEAYMLDKAHLLDRLEEDLGLAESLHANDRSTLIDRPSEASPEPANGAIKADGGRWRFALAQAACLMLAVGSGYWLAGSKTTRDLPSSSPPRIVFDAMRGVSSVSLSEPGRADSEIFIVEVAVPTGSKLLHATAIRAEKSESLPLPLISREGFVTFVFPKSWKDALQLEITFQPQNTPSPSILNLDVSGEMK